MENPESRNDRTGSTQQSAPGFWQIVKSTAAAGFGVQSNRNRERDFQHGKPLHFIIAGIIGTLVFLLAIVLLVKIVIATNT